MISSLLCRYAIMLCFIFAATTIFASPALIGDDLKREYL